MKEGRPLRRPNAIIAPSNALALRLHAEPLATHAAVYAQQSWNSSASILILSVKLLNDTGRRSYYTYFAIA